MLTEPIIKSSLIWFSTQNGLVERVKLYRIQIVASHKIYLVKNRNAKKRGKNPPIRFVYSIFIIFEVGFGSKNSIRNMQLPIS